MLYFAILLLLYSFCFHPQRRAPAVSRRLSKVLSTLQDSIPNSQSTLLSDKIYVLDHDNLGGKNTIGTSTPPSAHQEDVIKNGGAIMSGTITCHCIWYGDWSGSKGSSSSPQAQEIIKDFISNIANSSWWKVVTTYEPSLNIVLGNSANVNYLSTGSGQDMTYTNRHNELIVTIASNLNAFRLDEKSIYLVFPSEDVQKINGFCEQFCAFHHGFYSFKQGITIQTAYIGNTVLCPNLCGPITSDSINGNVAADMMVSHVAHEIAEMVTDPISSKDLQFGGWFDSTKAEIADKCAFKYEPTYSEGKANIKVGARDFLIQQLWINGGKGCSITL